VGESAYVYGHFSIEKSILADERKSLVLLPYLVHNLYKCEKQNYPLFSKWWKTIWSICTRVKRNLSLVKIMRGESEIPLSALKRSKYVPGARTVRTRARTRIRPHSATPQPIKNPPMADFLLAEGVG